MAKTDRIVNILRKEEKFAQEYRRLTGKPLGVTGEVAEYEAARLLGVTLMPARQDGYDAIERRSGRDRKLQIKGRCILSGGQRSQMLGTIRIGKEFDAVFLVLRDNNLNATAIYEVERQAVIDALRFPV